VLLGRMADGTWSPPSGIMLHTVGLGFLVGVDIYDCVVVINTQEALDAFSSIRCTLGGEVSAVAGPVGVGGVLESEVHKRQAPVFTYLKSRGFYAGVQMDGTIIIERTDENERFYGEQIPVKDILAGKVRHPPYEIKKLMETIKAAQGDSNVDESLLLDGPPPGDYEVQEADHSGEITFGIPDKEDPDPYGVLALQSAGLEIREAGTRARPTSEQFEFNPSPTSPIYSTFRKSMDHSSIDDRSMSRRSSWRTSGISSLREPRTPTMVDMCTQTDFDTPEPIKVPQFPPPLPKRHSRTTSRTPSPTLADIPELKPAGEVHPQEIEKEELAEEVARPTSSARTSKAFDDVNLDDDDEEEEEEEEPVIETIHQAAAPQVITRARVVQVAKVMPPKLPPRNPFRNRRISDSSESNDHVNHEMSANNSPAAGHSPLTTPSLKGDGSSASSLSSIEGLEHVSTLLQPKPRNETKEEQDDFHSLPASSIKAVPGGFN
jgi:hypothetical protein